uniref:crossover junction endodeoxyribonuclease RuvC n=1 Tax=Parasutterella excrementihominis TaxID=487175 RepID=UPI003FF119D4
MSQKAVRILGIDPGLNHTGYGFVDFVPGHFTYVASGVLNVPAGELSDRLGFIFKSLSALIEEHHPNVASIEKTFLNTNAQSSMLLSHARGAAMCAVACHSILCKEISTREIKKSVTGYGAADKEQVQQMVLRHLKLEDTRFSPDESDARDLLRQLQYPARPRTDTRNQGRQQRNRCIPQRLKCSPLKKRVDETL